jgi:hypothetical protein
MRKISQQRQRKDDVMGKGMSKNNKSLEGSRTEEKGVRSKHRGKSIKNDVT